MTLQRFMPVNTTKASLFGLTLVALILSMKLFGASVLTAFTQKLRKINGIKES